MKISIITINFNNLHGLKETTKSVLGQTYLDKELIVIDGGSSDGSAEYIKEHKDSFAYSVSEKDNGIYNAMNKGVKQATGDYVIFMNSGDRFFYCDVLKDVFEGKKISSDIVYGCTLCSPEPGKAFLRIPHALDVMWKNRISAICHQSAFIKCSLMKEVGYDERYRLLGDYAFFYYCYQYGCSFQEVNKIISVYETIGVSSNPMNRWQSYMETCMIHGQKANRYKYSFILLISSIKRIVKEILPTSLRKKLTRLPNGNMPVLPIENFKQL
jgi:glycosyltransferase involved in cell wall biosynthesis